MSVTSEPTLLIVEDDIFSGTQLQRTLFEYGYNVWLAGSGEEAIALVKQGDLPDIILMDIHLAANGLDGTQTTSAIHRLYDIPVVLHTGYVDEATFARAADMTQYGYVYKTPGNIQFILASLATALKLHATEMQLREREKNYRELSMYLQEVRERQSKAIAREIHDDLGQSLAALKMNLALMDVGDSVLDCSQQETVQNMQGIIDQTVETLRALINDLRPPVLDTSGVVDALRWHISTFKRDFNLTVQLDLEPPDTLDSLELDPETKLCVFRIVQEALNNVVRHAAASNAEVSLRLEADRLFVRVTDSGCGYDQQIAIEKGRPSFGLLGMHERAAAAGGQLRIHSEPGHGTQLQLELPLSGEGR